MSESDQQSALVRWFGLKYPALSAFLIAYPSGAIMGGKNKFALIAKLKREGWRSGVPDLFLAVPNKDYSGLFIEMKDQGKTQCSLSEEQKEYLRALNGMGYFADWCAGFEAAKAVIEEYLNDR